MASSEASPLPPATSPSVPDAPTPVTGETNPTGTQTQEGGITGTQSKEGGPTDDKEPVSFTDRDATKAGGDKSSIGKMIGQMKKKKKKKSKKKKTAKYKYTTDRFESNLFLMRLEGTLFCGGIMAGIILLVTNFLIVLIVGAFTGFNFGHVFPKD